VLGLVVKDAGLPYHVTIGSPRDRPDDAAAMHMEPRPESGDDLCSILDVGYKRDAGVLQNGFMSPHLDEVRRIGELPLA
jgi:hypothetical protein